jgi:hypothetical protein
MKARRALTLVAFFLFCFLAVEARIETVLAIDQANGTIQHANSSTLPSAATPVSAQDKNEPKHISIFASTQFEPLLLLLLGSTLLSFGTAINLVISRRLKAKLIKQIIGDK